MPSWAEMDPVWIKKAFNWSKINKKVSKGHNASKNELQNKKQNRR